MAADFTSLPIPTVALADIAPELWNLDSFRASLMAEVAASFNRGNQTGVTVVYNPNTRAFNLTATGATQASVNALGTRVGSNETSISGLNDLAQTLAYRISQVEKNGGGSGVASAYRVGFYTNNPTVNSVNQQNEFLANYDEWVRIMGVRPRSMNFFLDFAQPRGNWAADIYFKLQAMKNTGDAYIGTDQDFLPELGVGVAEPGIGHDEIFDAVRAGDLDQIYYDCAMNCLQSGFPLIHVRIMYEFNGGFMPWSPANSGRPNKNAEFIQVYQRIVSRFRAAQTAHQASGGTARFKFVWNPTAINYNSGGIVVEDLYPGDSYTDVIGPDSYGKMYPRALVDCRPGPTYGQLMSSFAEWSVIPENVYNYLSYNDMTQANLKGDGGGCSAERMAQFALDHGKEFSISECGSGNNDANVGPIDNYFYPRWLKGFLDRWIAKGLKVTNVNIWSTDQGDGGWGFLFGQRPLTALEWKAGFGKAIVDSGAPTALKFNANTDGTNYAFMFDRTSYRVGAQAARLEVSGKQVNTTAGAGLGGKWNTGNNAQQEFLLYRNGNGKLAMLWRTSAGVVAVDATASDNLSPNTQATHVVEFNPGTGLVRFYVQTTGALTQVGADVTATSTLAIQPPTSAEGFVLGQVSGPANQASPYQGTINAVKLTIGGAVVMNAVGDYNGLKDTISGEYFGRGSVPIVNAATALPYRPAP